MSREVIVSAGAIDTPKILMLSGVGPAAHLSAVGIAVVADNPAVGENLEDHVEGVISWEAAMPVPAETTQWWEIGVFTMTEPNLELPNLMYHLGTVPFDLQTYRHGYPTTDNGFCMTPNVTHGKSRGDVRLRSRDWRDKPLVDPRYFTDPEGHDEKVMLQGYRLAREIASQPALRPWIKRELAPGPDAQTDEELRDFARKTHNTVYHPACTCRMGAPADPAAAVDPQLRLKGVQNVRVADGSVMPHLTTVNPCITTMLIGEKCADLIRGLPAFR